MQHIQWYCCYCGDRPLVSGSCEWLRGWQCLTHQAPRDVATILLSGLTTDCGPSDMTVSCMKSGNPDEDIDHGARRDKIYGSSRDQTSLCSHHGRLCPGLLQTRSPNLSRATQDPHPG
jgi:hypothetical protein